MRSIASRSVLALGMVVGGGSLAWGGAYEIPNQGARGAAQSEAFIAQADDGSAIYYNPAGLTQLHGTTITGGSYFLFPDFRFDGQLGDAEMDMMSVLPHFYAASDFGTERWRFGIGLFNEFGLNQDWGDSGPLRTIVDDVQLVVLNISPTVAYQVNDNLSIAVAFNVYYGDFEQQRKVILGAPPTPEGRLRLGADDIAFGVTPALMWKIDDRNQIGFVYRSPFALNLEGTARLRGQPIGRIGPSPAKARLDFPQIIGFGYAFRPVEKLKVETDVVWTQWSTVDSIVIKSPNPAFNGQTIPASWRDGFSYRLGLQYDIDAHWALRGGYAYGQNAIPSNTFTPLVPDSNYHLFSIGGGYKRDNWSADLAYQYAYRETRHIEGGANAPFVNGTWENDVHALMVSFTYQF